MPGNYDKAIDMYKRLAALKNEYKNLYFVFGYTLSSLNAGQFQKTYEAVKSEIPSITYNDFHINLAQISDNYYSNGNLNIKPFGESAADEIAYVVSRRKKRMSAIEMIEHAFLKGLSFSIRKAVKEGREPTQWTSCEAYQAIMGKLPSLFTLNEKQNGNK